MPPNLKFTTCLILLVALGGGCSSSEKKPENGRVSLGNAGAIPGLPKASLALIPKAKTYTGEIAPIIRDILPGSVAQTSNFKLGDQLISLNGEHLYSAAEFEQKIKHAPMGSTIVFKRGGQLHTEKVILGMERPRFGAGFEPEGVALVKTLSPFVSFMHQKEFTVFAETSINEGQNTLHINAILKSNFPLTVRQVKYSVYDRGLKSYLGSGTAKIDAPSTDSRIFKKAFHKSSGFKGPISVALDVQGKRFHFEFQ
jgi:membrane-associated protease RseP (regulator of RpoE activity)